MSSRHKTFKNYRDIGGNMDDYLNELGYSADDLKEPEELVFTAKDRTKFKIMSFSEINKPATADKKAFKAFILNTKVLSGEYKDKLFTMFINKAHKNTYVPFLRCFWSVKELEDALASGSLADKNRIIGGVYECTPTTAKKVGDKWYQSFYGYKKAEEEEDKEVTPVDFS